MCEHDGVEVYVASRRQFSVSSFHHKVLEAKAVSTLTASVLPIVPLRHFNIPQPCTLGVWFWDGVWFFFFRLVLNLLGLGFWPSCLKFLSIRDYGLLSSGLCLQFFISTHLELCVCGGGCEVPKCTYGGLSVLATLFHLWKTADAWSTTILTALLSNLKRASDSWVPGWQVYTATHGCSSCTTPLEFSQSSFQQR